MYPSDGQGVSQGLGRQLLYLDRASVGFCLPLAHLWKHRHVGGGFDNVNAKRDETGVKVSSDLQYVPETPRRVDQRFGNDASWEPNTICSDLSPLSRV